MTIQIVGLEILRVTYGTTTFGDNPKLEDTAAQIKKLRFDVQGQVATLTAVIYFQDI